MQRKSMCLALSCCLSLGVCFADSIINQASPMPTSEKDKAKESDFFVDYDEEADVYLEGYIQALVDANYYEYTVAVSVQDHVVHLYNLPRNQLLANSIISFVSGLPGVESVEVEEELTEEQIAERQKYIETSQVKGVWFPQSTVLFAPLVADPRQPTNSLNYRSGDRVMGKSDITFSIGDDFPVFRWKDVWRWHGDLQIGVEACVWAVFNCNDDVPDNDNGNSCEFMNADYMLGFPLTYAFDNWSFRLRGYHISTHLGDEFLCNHPEWICSRKNPSFEAIDFFASYQLSSKLRLYAGQGVVVHSDKSFHIKPFYVEGGFELRVWGRRFYYHRLYGTPFFAVHLESWQQHHWQLDATYKLGYEWSKLQGVGRKMRLYVDYHHGFSPDGQFMNQRTQYAEAGISWGF